MSTYYLDTSALVKCYACERGTDWMRALVQSPHPQHLATGRLAGPELVAAADDDLLQAAAAEGLVTDNPNRYA